uniref:Leucine rich immune protein (Coil-less) n=1 Tax=Anopheles maculatus TaxID=74869 RepID=A0A182S8H4_9DIPT
MVAHLVSVLLLIACGCLPLAYSACIPSMGNGCTLESLNMLTNGTATLRKIEANKFYSIRVQMLRLPNNPSGPFLSFAAEFVDDVEMTIFREQLFQIPARTNLSSIQVFEAKALKQVQIADGGDISIKELTFIDCGIDHVPQTIGNLPLLYTLTFSQCALRNVSLKTFAKNSQLKFVDLSSNAIDTIVPLSNEDSNVALSIEDLYLSSNRLEHLDMSVFSALSNLVMLDLRYNNLARIVAERAISWPKLEIFDVSNNQLRALDLQWLSAPNLTRLLLNNNLLDKIPQRLRRFANLQLVGLGDNQFAGIDLAPLNGLPTLNTVDFSNNPKSRYVRSSRPIQLPMLDTLYVEYCALSRFNTTGIDLPVVSFISLAHNNFSTVPPLGIAFPSISSFSLYDNPIGCGVLKSRKELLLSGKLIMGPPLDVGSCSGGSISVSESYELCFHNVLLPAAHIFTQQRVLDSDHSSQVGKNLEQVGQLVQPVVSERECGELWKVPPSILGLCELVVGQIYQLQVGQRDAPGARYNHVAYSIAYYIDL